MTGKRGRPRKNPVVDITKPKLPRGRPAKTQIVVEETPVEVEIYTPPKVMRRIRVFRFEKRIFHSLMKISKGNLILASYILNEMMKMYIEHKINITYDMKYYYKWCESNPQLEPLEEKETATSNAIMSGIPLQYKYPMIYDEEVWNTFQRVAEKYPPFILNILIDIYIKDQNIDLSKYKEWCNLE